MGEPTQTDEARLCKHCQKVLKRRRQESSAKFARRASCDIKCAQQYLARLKNPLPGRMKPRPAKPSKPLNPLGLPDRLFPVLAPAIEHHPYFLMALRTHALDIEPPKERASRE
jgi:hypothetical protein